MRARSYREGIFNVTARVVEQSCVLNAIARLSPLGLRA
jgi:hypothetical protein